MKIHSISNASTDLSVHPSTTKRLIARGDLEKVEISDNRVGITDESKNAFIERARAIARGDWTLKEEEVWQQVARRRVEALERRRAARVAQEAAA